MNTVLEAVLWVAFVVGALCVGVFLFTRW